VRALIRACIPPKGATPAEAMPRIVSLAIDRYLRLRRHHRLAETSSDLWLGGRGKQFSYDGLSRS